MKVASEQARRHQLQILFHDELKDTRETIELKRGYGNTNAGPTIREALNQQRNLMKNCAAILEECDAKDVFEG